VRTFWSVLLTCAVCIPISAAAQNSDYETGEIVAVEKAPSMPSANAGTDAPVPEDVKRYNLSIKVNGTAYTCRAKTSRDIDLDWAQGKQVQVKPKGKVMYVKRANGSIAKLSIVASKKAD